MLSCPCFVSYQGKKPRTQQVCPIVEGPFHYKQMLGKGAYMLSFPKDSLLDNPINGLYLKNYTCNIFSLPLGGHIVHKHPFSPFLFYKFFIVMMMSYKLTILFSHQISNMHLTKDN